MTINNIPTSASYGGSFTPTFTSVGDGTITVASLTTSACTVAIGVLVSYIDVGLCTWQASITEGDYYLATTGAAQSFTINKASATVTFATGNPAVLPVSAPGGASPRWSIDAHRKCHLTGWKYQQCLGRPSHRTPLAGGTPYTLICNTTPASGTTKTFTCMNTGFAIAVGTYDVTATVTGDYYTGEGYDAFTVYDPSLGLRLAEAGLLARND